MTRIPLLATVHVDAEDFEGWDEKPLRLPVHGAGGQWRLVFPIGSIDAGCPETALDALAGAAQAFLTFGLDQELVASTLAETAARWAAEAGLTAWATTSTAPDAKNRFGLHPAFELACLFIEGGDLNRAESLGARFAELYRSHLASLPELAGAAEIPASLPAALGWLRFDWSHVDDGPGDTSWVEMMRRAASLWEARAIAGAIPLGGPSHKPKPAL